MSGNERPQIPIFFYCTQAGTERFGFGSEPCRKKTVESSAPISGAFRADGPLGCHCVDHSAAASGKYDQRLQRSA